MVPSLWPSRRASRTNPIVQGSTLLHTATYMYADDLTCLATGDTQAGGTAASCVGPLQQTADIVGQWCRENNMSVSGKTEGILFTSADNTQADRVPITIHCPPLDIHITVPVVGVTSNSPRLLGVLFDHRMTMGAHVEKVVKAATASINQLAMIANSCWGPSTHSLRTFYKGYIESGRHLVAPACGVPQGETSTSTETRAPHRDRMCPRGDRSVPPS